MHQTTSSQPTFENDSPLHPHTHVTWEAHQNMSKAEKDIK